MTGEKHMTKTRTFWVVLFLACLIMIRLAFFSISSEKTEQISNKTNFAILPLASVILGESSSQEEVSLDILKSKLLEDLFGTDDIDKVFSSEKAETVDLLMDKIVAFKAEKVTNDLTKNIDETDFKDSRTYFLTLQDKFKRLQYEFSDLLSLPKDDFLKLSEKDKIQMLERAMMFDVLMIEIKALVDKSPQAAPSLLELWVSD